MSNPAYGPFTPENVLKFFEEQTGVRFIDAKTQRPVLDLIRANKPAKELFGIIRSAIMNQGEDVTEKATKLYFAFKRTRNFATIVNGKKGEWLLQLHLNPDEIQLEENWRDVRNIGIWGTGQLQIRVTNQEQIAVARPLLQKAYEGQV